MSKPRLLAIFGSGETSRRAVEVYRELCARFDGPVTAVVLGTTYAFQENAAEHDARLTEFLRDHTGMDARVAGAGSGSLAALCADVEEADLVFAGPGSPSYALRRWQGTPLPQLLAGKLDRGGAVVFASAAACTLGVRALPVYEIYKVGEDPRWLPGLDLLASTGLRAAVIPHFDNTEGRTHDTRYCYVGERRLRVLEDQLADGTVLLGVDEHTALVCDLDADRGLVRGRGGVTLRRPGGDDVVFAAPADVPLDKLRAWAAGRGETVRPARPGGTRTDVERAVAASEATSLVDVLLGLEARARAADLEPEERAAAGRELRAGLVHLARQARAGARLRDELLIPLVETLVAVRAQARERGDYEEADALRDRLEAAGVEVRDTPAGTTWRYRH